MKACNRVGLIRAGFSEEAREIIKRIYKIFYRRGLTVPNALKVIREELPQTPEVVGFLDFCNNTKRGVVSANCNDRHA